MTRLRMRLQSFIPAVLLTAGLALLPGFSEPIFRESNGIIKAEYVRRLIELDSATVALQRSILTNQPTRVVQARFRLARIAYKRTEWITEYYYPVSARKLNGPPVPEGEVDDGIGRQTEPQGFQVVEENLFPYDRRQKDALLAQLTQIRRTNNVLWQVGTSISLSEGHLFDAIRLEVFRIVTMSLSGFDSPIDFNSLPESIESLKSIQQALKAYPIARFDPALAIQLDQTTNGAIAALTGQSFNKFDRLAFIKNYANPLSNLLVEARLALKLPVPTDKRFLSNEARTLSDSGAFNPMFFAPDKAAPPTPERVELGIKLFSNPALSGNGQRSCATCHQPDRAFQDGQTAPLMLGSTNRRISRNTPTLFNAALQGFQFLDSRVFSVEDQISDVLQNPLEMHGSFPGLIHGLNHDMAYVAAFAQAYPGQGITQQTVTNALASYVRSLVSLDARFDRYLRNEPVALTKVEKLGFNVFMGKARCGTCHYFPIFNGTLPPAYIKTESEVIGTPANADERTADADSGRFQSTRLAIHYRAFKIPSLRHIAQTAPYMHNGAYQTLEQVIEFYNKGGGNGLGFNLPNQTLPADKLKLTAIEKRALVAFMKTL